MSIPRLNVGDRVYLISPEYPPSQADPVKGSTYECKGTVYKIAFYVAETPFYVAEVPFNCWVEWDNGAFNSYNIRDNSVLINANDSNYRSIW